MDPRAATQPKYTNQSYAVPMMSPDCGHIQQPQPVQQQQPQSLHSLPMQDMVAEQSRLQESLKRSVTLVFWYKAGCEPIRLHQEIPTFPLFQLSQFTQLVNDLGYTANSYVDMYNPHSATWEQQTITAVRVVDSEQRLLYRVRKSLLEGLTHDECPGVAHEINMQPQLVEHTKVMTPRTATKRPSTDGATYNDTSHPNKYVRVDSSGGAGSESISPTRMDSNNRGYIHNQVMPGVHMQSPTSEVQQPTYTIAHQPQVDPQPQARPQQARRPTESPSLASSSTPETSRSPIPYHPHPPLKRWPNDYCVSEIANGFRQMDGMIAHQPAVTQKIAFERVFGCRYIKSTVCRHRAVWKRSDQATRDAYEAMGLDERAVWGDFVKKVEGKPDKNTPQQQTMPQAPPPRSNMTQTMQLQPQQITLIAGSVGMGPQHGGGGMDGTGVGRRMDDEPAMASLGPPPPGHPGPVSLHTGAVG
ncbi:hypothetical protein BXZ70DRAFT_920845 [Cristinia sonorae]|uniref:Uncharacterized protein n=1 Tax=Cristinia sonorae TaxID=1940300 RepID=A0A8K0XTD8_9AGAR|nr:hypothetical protein BXZ70DRAFT_920845 [Cristinia sonorae]